MVEKEEWTDWMDDESGKLLNPRKRLFLKLTAEVIRDVSAQRDKDVVLYSRKEMIQCGITRNLKGVWEVKHNLPHLQSIFSRCKDNFDGKTVAKSMKLDG